MKIRPSHIPLWLLSRLGCGRDIDSLIGDLIEEYRTGRSLSWLWWQAVVGVVTTFYSEFRAQPVVTNRTSAIAAVILILALQTIGTVDAPEIQYSLPTIQDGRVPTVTSLLGVTPGKPVAMRFTSW